MNPWRWVDPRVEAVRVADLESYFLRRGWKARPEPGRNLLRFEKAGKAGGPSLFQVFPSSEGFTDYRQRVTELLTTLSELEGRHPVEVLEDVLAGATQSGVNGPAAGSPKAVRK
jgi:hypothetical protein